MLLALTLCSSALASDPRLAVDVWTSRHGMPQNSATDLLFSDDGYLWLTTFGGIARFDGWRFQTYTPASSPQLEDTRFTSIAQTPDGALWFGSLGGKLYRLEDGRFDVVLDGLQGVWDLVVGEDGRLWVASVEGVWVRGDGHFVQHDPREAARLLVLDEAILAEGDGGLRCLHGDCSALEGQPFIFGSWLGGTLWGIRDFHYARIDSPEPLSNLLPRSSTWLGPRPVAWRGGVWAHDGEALIQLDGTERFELPGKVRSLIADEEGGLWLGMNGGGLRRVSLRGLVAIYEGYGHVWPTEGGLVAWGCSGHAVLAGPAPPGLPDSACGQGFFDGERWWFDGGIRSDGPGLFVHRGGRWEKLLDGYPDMVGPRWMVLEGVLHRLGEEGAVPIDDGGRGPFRPIQEDGEGGVWLQREREVFHHGPDGFERVGAISTAVPIRDVLELEDDVWVGTYGAGMQLVGEAISVDRRHGLCDDAVSRMIRVGDDLWMNTNRGAGRVPLQDLRDMRAGLVDAVRCELVDTGEGNGRSGAFFDGHLFFPTIHGVVEIDPSTALQRAVPPKVRVENARCGSVMLEEDTEVWEPCDLVVQVTGLAYDDPIGLRFRHRLLGADGGEHWTELYDGRRIEVLGIEPGSYRLQVQARSSRGLWSRVAELSFVRRPAWWERTEVRIGVPAAWLVVALGGLGWRLWSASRQNRDLREEVERRQRAEAALLEQQREKERALEELAEARRMEALGRLAVGVGHDVNDLLMVVFAAMDRLRGVPGVGEDVDRVTRAAERASGLTRQLLSLGRRSAPPPEWIDASAVVAQVGATLAEQMGLGVRLDVRPGLKVRLGAPRLEQLVTQLVHNAAAANARSVGLRLDVEGEEVVLEVQDDGIGMPEGVLDRVFEPYFFHGAPGRGAGLGLAMVRSVVEDAGGQVGIRSTEGEGTTITIRFPALRSALQGRGRSGANT